MNQIRHGDAAHELSKVDNESVHCIITSPPYWNQRDYGHDEQIGQEDGVESYISSLTEIAEECYRVLRDDGSFLLNVGDTYTSKERNLIPFKIAQRLSEEVGFVLRQDCIWKKDHAKPDPATDRRATEHEYVFHFTKQRDYWYDETVCDGDHTSVVTAPTASSNLDHLAVYSEQLVEELLEGVVPPEVCDECGCPYVRDFERVPRPFADPDRQQARRAHELYDESGLTQEHIEAVQAVGISDVGKAVETEDGAGRNTDEVAELACEAKEVLGGYYREFTMVEKIPTGWRQQCSCNAGSVGGVVCDPFVGSGTTTKVARQQGYRYLGIDINGENAETARNRTSEVIA